VTKTQVAILWGLSVLVVVVFVLLSQVISRAPSSSQAVVAATAPPQAAARLPGGSHTVRSLYPRADQAARTWNGDAVLVSATASWPFARLDDLSQATDWVFQFYSPGTHQIYVVGVGPERITPIVGSHSPYALSAIPPEQWQVDSHVAISTWLDHGGAQFLSGHSVVDVSARLRYGEDGRSAWTVMGMARDQDLFHTVTVDAASGQVME
jgi:hypothetical protein